MEKAELAGHSPQSHGLVGKYAFKAVSRRIGGAVDEKAFLSLAILNLRRFLNISHNC